jgi:hypothetical protein
MSTPRAILTFLAATLAPGVPVADTALVETSKPGASFLGKGEVMPEGSPYRDYIPEYDAVGNRYPDECRRDLSFVSAPVRLMPRQNLMDLYERLAKMQAPRQGINGFVAFSMLPRPVIYIASDLSPKMIEATTHHERCHVLFMDTTKNTHWHPAWKPNGGKR